MFGWYGTCIYFLYFFWRHKHLVIELSMFCFSEGAIFTFIIGVVCCDVTRRLLHGDFQQDQ